MSKGGLEEGCGFVTLFEVSYHSNGKDKLTEIIYINFQMFIQLNNISVEPRAHQKVSLINGFWFLVFF